MMIHELIDYNASKYMYYNCSYNEDSTTLDLLMFAATKLKMIRNQTS